MQSIREVLRAMRRGQKQPLRCPVCGSPVRRTRASLDGWILPEKFYCVSCRYTGFIAMEKDETGDETPSS